MATYSSAGTGSTYSSYSLTLTEQHIYAAKRVGIESRNADMKATFVQGNVITTLRGTKTYELGNHLDNALVMISDKKIGVSSNGTTVDYYTADVVSANDYYAFGMLEPGRTFNGGNYRYGFNGKENDNDVKGAGDQLDYGSRIYDPRVGKFLSVDPKTRNFAFYSPYHFSGNNPIRNIDLDGGEPKDYFRNWDPKPLFDLGTGKRVDEVDLTYRVWDSKLGYMDARLVYDKWTQKSWFVADDDQGNHYYLKNDNGNSSEMSVRPDKKYTRLLTHGHFEKFEIQDRIDARMAAKSSDMLGTGVFMITVGIVGWEAGLWQFGSAGWGERLANAGSDLTVQLVQHKFNFRQINWASTIAAGVWVNPFKAAAAGSLLEVNADDGFKHSFVFGDKSIWKVGFETGVVGGLNWIGGRGIEETPIWCKTEAMKKLFVPRFKDVYLYATHANTYGAISGYIYEKVADMIKEKKEKEKKAKEAAAKAGEKKE
jgi:RHS repeat-associated protein